MSLGAAPNLSGGLWMGGMGQSALDSGNGNSAPPLTGSCNADGGGDGQCSAGGGSGTGGGAQLFDSSFHFMPATIQGWGQASWMTTDPPSTSCPPAIGGPTPVPVPASSPYSANITVMGTQAGTNYVAAALPVTCVETGVTQTALCTPNGGPTTWYLPVYAMYTFTTPGGVSKACPQFNIVKTFGSGSAITGPTLGISINVTAS